MKTGRYIRSLLTGGDDHKAVRQLQAYREGQTMCAKCGARLSFAGQQPLAMVRCPLCQSGVFVPWKLLNWWVMRPLRAGGFSSVYLGRADEDPERKVAVKVLQRSQCEDPYIQSLFEQELDMAYSLEPHPCLADIHAVGEQDGILFLVEDFVRGERLNEYAGRLKRTPCHEEYVHYALDVAEALAFLYNAGFVYRDTKPENVIVRTPDHRAILIDYGGCMTIEDAWDRNDLPVIGSPIYMPPERLLREGEDMRGDVYSLGMTLYRVLTGEEYFTPTELQNLVKGHTSRLRRRTEDKMKGFDPALVALIDGMIRRNREKRIASYPELLAAIRETLAGMARIPTTDPVLKQRRKLLNKPEAWR